MPLANEEEHQVAKQGAQSTATSASTASIGNQSNATPTSSPSSSASSPSSVSVGERCSLIPGVSLLDMVDSTDLYLQGDVAGWKARLDRDGYILLRSVLPLPSVIQARECVCSVLSNDWNKIDLVADPTVRAVTDQATAQERLNSTPLLRARIACDATNKRIAPGLILTGFRAVTHDPRMLRLIEGPEVAFLMEQLYGRTQLDRELQKRSSKPSHQVSAPSSNSNSILPLHPPAASHASTSSESVPPSTIPASTSAPFSSHIDDPSSLMQPQAPFLASASTFDTKWVRVHGQGEFTDEHSDYYRFEHSCSNGSSNNSSASDNESLTSDESNPPENGAADMFTVWIPLGDYPLHHGTLVVAEGTHRLDGYRSGVYEHESKSELPPDFEKWQRNGSSHRSSDSSEEGNSSSGENNNKQGVWRSTHFHPGDLVLFDLRLVHASTKNQTNNFRMSVDTRWKPTSRLTHEEGDTFKPVASGRKLGFADSQR